MLLKEFKDRKGNMIIKPADRKVNNQVSVYGIAIQGDNILLVKPVWKDEFDLPGGGIEKDENITEALKREFLEETGYLIRLSDENPIKIKKEFFYADDLDIFFKSKLIFLLVEIISKDESVIIDKKEIKEIVWIDLNNINNYRINQNCIDILNELK